jgi:hypothetical protein
LAALSARVSQPLERQHLVQPAFGKSEPVIGNSLEEIALWIPDSDIFVDQGCSALLILPIIYKGATIGLITKMGEPDHFSRQAVERIKHTTGGRPCHSHINRSFRASAPKLT